MTHLCHTLISFVQVFDQILDCQAVDVLSTFSSIFISFFVTFAKMFIWFVP